MRINKNSKKLLYSPSEHNWRRIDKNLYINNLLKVLFKNFTDILWSNSLGKASRNILQGKEMRNSLIDISNSKNLLCGKLFYSINKPIDYLDFWYLDINPYRKYWLPGFH